MQRRKSQRDLINEISTRCAIFFNHMSSYCNTLSKQYKANNIQKEASKVDAYAQKQPELPRAPEPVMSKGYQVFDKELRQILQDKFPQYNDFEIGRLMQREWGLLDAITKEMYENNSET